MHRGIPVGLLLTTLAPVGPAGVVSFGLSGYSYAWPALEKATHVGVHLIDPQIPAEARLAECFSRTSVDGFLPEVAWHVGPDGVALLDDAPRRAIARPTQRVHVGSHVVVVARLLA
jgi:flavin reductase (DIM6/NTAB) family NADH-FMN oxidoreductase RutF